MSDASISASYELSRKELARGLSRAPTFRRQVVMLACLSLPTLVLFSGAPSTRIWMVPPVAALLFWQVYRVPWRRAGHVVPRGATVRIELEVDTTRIKASGPGAATARWEDVVAVGDGPWGFQVEVADGPVIAIPRRALAQPEAARFRRFASAAPARLPRWPLWTMLGVSAALAAAILLSLEYPAEHVR